MEQLGNQEPATKIARRRSCSLDASSRLLKVEVGHFEGNCKRDCPIPLPAALAYLLLLRAYFAESGFPCNMLQNTLSLVWSVDKIIPENQLRALGVCTRLGLFQASTTDGVLLLAKLYTQPGQSALGLSFQAPEQPRKQSNKPVVSPVSL